VTGQRLHDLALGLPEVEQVVVEGWDNEMTYRVAGKVFIFGSPLGTGCGLKVGKELASALVEAEPRVSVMPYLGRHGWVSVDLGGEVEPGLWDEVADWIRTSYRLVAPKRLAKLVAD
jgi:predicted DNA-binding protein (MmcQ/YjbR family)